MSTACSRRAGGTQVAERCAGGPPLVSGAQQRAAGRREENGGEGRARGGRAPSAGARPLGSWR
ncbi:MAG: hypothetical protein ACK55Z_25425, partial [bacterium]